MTYTRTRPARIAATASLTATGTAFLTLAACVAVASNYALQPAVHIVATDFRLPLSGVGIVAAATLFGYLLGLALVVPLIDRFPPGYLLGIELALLGGAIVIAAVATSLLMLVAAFVFVGALAPVSAQMSSLASKLAGAGHRAVALGTVTAGISAGILLGRLIGGQLTGWLGWRGMLLTIAAACGVFAVLAVCVLPRHGGSRAVGYLSTLRGTPGLFVHHRVLRVSAVSGALWFFSFNLIWLCIAVVLASPPFGYAPSRIGLYSVAGLLGLLVTRVAGTLADRFGSRRVILGGLSAAILGAVVLLFFLAIPSLAVAGLALFDAGLFAAQVANQARVIALDPISPARFNSAYLLVYFVGGAVGVGAGPAIVAGLDWTGAVLFAAGAILIAAVITTGSQPSKTHALP
jgi:predicted MFS family arabinose efflux permease